ncbi:MAG TPA: DUF885 domain-containing protein [Steroidobacteraceae bacterium]|nr:DUF885 domain-containing protein [Steroidobacteraceae bacterium]
MPGFCAKVWCVSALFALAGCGAPSTPAPSPPAKAPPPIEQLKQIVERYWDEHLPAENAISPQILADSLSIERRYLAEVQNVARDALDAPSRLTYDIFRKQRETNIEGFTFPKELLPINPFGGMTQELAAQAAEMEQHPGATASQYENWLKRIDDYVLWTQQAVVNMRDGVRRGYTSPRAVIERMLPILERLGIDDSANVFYAPLRAMQQSIKDPERARLTREMTAAISGRLLPANRALHDFLQKEYLPRARTSLALAALPLGREWYAFLVKRETDTALTPEEINRIGIAEVERLGVPPPREPAPLPANGPASAYKDLEVQVQAAMPAAFAETLPADLDIRATEWLTPPAEPLYYRRGGPAGAPPAILYVDTLRTAKAFSIADFLQRGLPGEHFQIALQQLRTDLPRFRRFGADAAFTRGWGLYAASLGDTLGLYTDESAKLDAAAVQMRCAVGLVVDTSLHAKGWTRSQAVDYLRVHLGIDNPDAQALIDGYATSPADALACLGEMRFRALRARAQQRLSARFDLKEFHSEILQGGAMPLDILETKMNSWMDASK